MPDVLLDDVVVVLGDREVEAGEEMMRPPFDRILRRRGEGDELGVDLELREVEAWRRSRTVSLRPLERPFESGTSASSCAFVGAW